MKKLRLLNILATGLIVLTIVGCSSAAASDDQTTAEQSTRKEANSKSVDLAEVDVYGEVSEVIGNEVTLKLLKIPDMSAVNREKGTGGAPTDSKAEGGAATGTPPTDGAAAGAAGGGAGGGMREKQYTGEVKTIIIPVGTPIVSMTRGEEGMVETEISMNELTSGNTLSIYYQEDGKTIEKITIRKPRTGGGQGGQGGQGGPDGPGWKTGN
ncbi:hypothetical protein [Neobacillus sp. DY30]|uniref:hypothetical protein n=1 Tax=Neobacillus sp. DY30 TaxID=3047871 RepID=UPI0024BF24C0|nr:hypothetical protein [Neobacillus sp. DY30]WHY02665.1 hypothetical protein QNH29_10760 [Neobacillus sp. DY30]